MDSDNGSGFSNLPISTEQLAPLAALQLEPVAERYRLLRQALNAAVYTGLWLLLLFVVLQPWWPLTPDVADTAQYGLWLLPLLAAIRALYCWQSDKHKFFALREHDISFRSGIFFQKIITQPVVRVQHIELKQGPLERKAELARLQLFSAGGAMHTFEIPGLKLSQAQQIRQFVLKHKDALQDEQQ